MSDSRIAVRYAKPLIELADEKGRLEKVKADMENFLAICNEERSFALMLRNPIVPHLKKGAILNEVFKGKYDQLTLTIFEIITRKNREFVLQSVAEEFLLLYNSRKGIENAVIKTPLPLDKKLRDQFTKIIKEVTGKTVELKEEIDESLIGGFTLKIGDRMIDDSVQAKLRDLKYSLIDN